MKRLLVIFLLCCFLIIAAFLLFGQMEQRMEATIGVEKSLVAYAFFSSPPFQK